MTPTAADPANKNIKTVLRWPVVGVALVVGLVGILALAGVLFRLATGVVPSAQDVDLPDPQNRLRLPQDFGDHPEFLIEWRRVAGWLRDEVGRKFAFVIDFYRNDMPPRASLFRRQLHKANNRYCAELLLIDAHAGHAQHVTKFGTLQSDKPDDRGVIAFRLDDWSMTVGGLQMELDAAGDGNLLKLGLRPEKKPVLRGTGGYHWRGEDGVPTYFLGYSRLSAEGNFVADGKGGTVRGSAFLEHEFTSYRAGRETSGFDRLTIVLDNFHEMTLIRVRRADGGTSPDSPLSLVLPDGDVRELTQDEYQLQEQGHWKSPDGKATYPIAWKLVIPQYQAELELAAPVAELEFVRRGGVERTWTGPLDVEGHWGDWRVRGEAMAELSGYAKPGIF
ncbi:MAG: lipocalin family protein [Candidatus Lernaella stagnicola]|nr:lipocalin family protein [Candidatus Lernaella stagnicola]